MCSEPGQKIIKNDIIGLNPYLFEMANIREQCSWVTEDKQKATEKARALVSAAVSRVFYIVLKDGTTPQQVAIIHCVGSRDEKYHEYCSRVCCMYSMKFAHLVKEHTEAEVYEFYIDLRSFGKGFEEFYNRVLDEGTIFIRGRPAEITNIAETPAVVDQKICSGCQNCLMVCPYNAISFDEDKWVLLVNQALCKGCGACVGGCPSDAITLNHFTNEQILSDGGDADITLERN